MSATWQTTVSGPGYEIRAAVQIIGKDVLIVLTGGDHPHIGAVTMISAAEPAQTVRYPSHDGRLHKDNYLSERIAKQLGPILPGSLTVTAGLHVDHISQKQLTAAGPLTEQLGQQLADWLRTYQFSVTPPKYYQNNEHPA